MPDPNAIFAGEDCLPFRICSTVKAEPVHWLWQPYIPRGALTLIAGDGGYGKSFMTCSLAADLSAGRPLPGQDAQAPCKVLMISAEDGLGPVIMPRLTVLDAAMENIAVLDEGFVLNPGVTKRILKAVDQFDAAVVFVDPLVVYLGGEVDSHKANEVRAILSQLTRIAKAKDIAIVAVHHVSKGLATGQHRTLGSVDFVNGVRSELLVDCSKSGTYFLSHGKSNWAKKGPTIAYNFNNERFTWLGNYEPPKGVDGEIELSRTPRSKTRAFITNVLADGPVPMIEVLRLAHDAGIGERSLNAAKKGIARSVRKTTDNHGHGQWFWELEEGAEPHPVSGGQSIATLAARTPQVTIHAPDQGLESDAIPAPSPMTFEELMALSK